ncbi:uncharacterized protein LOC112138368 [Oryzias melastigma]|uniref:uncharacterized protein LOC112138368 n=1 Tax=Oryzias melastigma TaxID=30732 RepID=UPI000CF7D17D|nr:uncharacterized protein LOC112138368 [Oryzias melastigma]
MDDCVPRTPCNERGQHRRVRRESPRTPTTREMGAVTRTDIFRKIESLCEKMDFMEEKLEAVSQTQEVLLQVLKNQATRTPDTKTPTELSTLVRHIYINLGEQLQWKVRPTDHFRTKHNEEVTATVVQAVKDVEPNWSYHQVRRACNRAFENIKSRERIEREGRKDDVKRRKLLTSRRDRLFRKRVKIAEKILNQEDLLYIQGSNSNFVSDEESDEEKTGFNFSSPKWRSTRLTRLMAQCQKELDENRKKGIEPRSTHTRKSAGFTARNPPPVNSSANYLAEEWVMDS